MSVIWSGVTEEGAVVPVQVTAEGKVVAVGDGPEGDYLELTGGNLTGDLTLGTNKITLATTGKATFAGGIDSGGNPVGGTEAGCQMLPSGRFNVSRASGSLFLGYKEGSSSTGSTSSINADGKATFAGGIDSGGNPVGGTEAGCQVSPAGRFTATRAWGSDLWRGYTTGDGKFTSRIDSNGSATFTGDVVIGSRNKQWLIRESNGVAMLIEQTLLKQPREIEKVRDLPHELDLIETALNEIMDKLRMTPPAGWPVWDGQSEVTSDNDNA